jgi:S-DNA-T family DNA segregation ATPase FtsK/SpoIIIE
VTASLAPVTVGIAADGTPLTIPTPGDGGAHVLIAGATGAGKSTALAAVLAVLAARPDQALILLDPKRVELTLWADRATTVAPGVTACSAALTAAVALMDRRYAAMAARKQRLWTGARATIVIDELASLTQPHPDDETGGLKARMSSIGRLAAEGRAAGVGIIAATQRPDHRIIPLSIRDNCRTRIACGMESVEGSITVLGARGRSDWPAHEIPTSLPGACWVAVDRHATPGRVWHLSDGDIDAVVASTRHLRIPPNELETP